MAEGADQGALTSVATSPPCKRRRRGSSKQENESPPSASAIKIGGSKDILTEIFRRLPPKPLIHCQLLSKTTNSLISNPNFSRIYKPKPTSGFYIYKQKSPTTRKLIPKYIPLTPNQSAPAHARLTVVNSLNASILQTCNGLLLCEAVIKWDVFVTERKYYVCNPTTKKRTLIPKIEGGFTGISLAFDPSVSNGYKLVCVVFEDINNKVGATYSIGIYSSETGCWRDDVSSFSTHLYDIDFKSGVYVNGAVHWAAERSKTLVYFDLGSETMNSMPMPLSGENEHAGSMLSYLGGCGGRLLAVLQNTRDEILVFEMDKDYSKWWGVKYFVDLNVLARKCSPFVKRNEELYYDLVSVVQGETERDLILVLYLPKAGRFISYNLNNKVVSYLCKLQLSTADYDRLRQKRWMLVHQLIEYPFKVNRSKF